MTRQKSNKTIKKNHFIAFCENIASLAGILAIVLVFHVFIAKGSVIPTGSMADNLRGDHFHLTCPACGFQYNTGYSPRLYINPQTQQSFPEGYRPDGPTPLIGSSRNRANGPVCPMCLTPADVNIDHYVSRGDQIWVLKCYYQVYEPKIWDVIVFKNPSNPDQDYIKRLIGCPGQTVEIIDGDIYIDNTIQKKTPLVQNALWLNIFDSRFLNALEPAKNTRFTADPFKPTDDKSKTLWLFDLKDHRWNFTGDPGEHSLVFDPDRLKMQLAGFCAYNGPYTDRRYQASDLKIELDLKPERPDGRITLILTKYNRQYAARIDYTGSCSLHNLTDNTTLAQTSIPALPLDRTTNLEFQNVDHRLTLCIDGRETLTFDGPNAPADWGYKTNEFQPAGVQLAAAGAPCSVTNLKLARDEHYTNWPLGAPDSTRGRATEGYPLKLEKDQFFALGDNSPFSHDSRFWQEPCKDPDLNAPPGIVPRGYIIGKPLCVYWPAAYRLPFRAALPIIPNAGELRFIH